MNDIQEKLPPVPVEELWQCSISEFNEWRRKNDFPRILAFLKSNLPFFTLWQDEQKVSSEDLIFFGPARFIKGNPSSIFIIEFEDFGKGREQRIIGYDTTIKYYEENIDRYGKFHHSHRITPYFRWARNKNHIPKKRDYGADLAGLCVSYVEDGSHHAKSLPLMQIGKTRLENVNISGYSGWENPERKNFEFLSLDKLHLINCNSHEPLRLDFSSAKEMILQDSMISYVNGYNTSFRGLRITDSILFSWRLENCTIKTTHGKLDRISNTEIDRWKVFNTPFFQFYQHLEMKDCLFYYRRKEEKEFRNIKNIYSSQGDFRNAGLFYFKEKKAHILKRVDFFEFYSRDLPWNKKSHSTNFASNRHKFRSAEVSNFRALIDFFKLIFYKTKILLTPKYFLLCLKNYLIVLGMTLDYLARGFGEKPFWIIRSIVVLIFVFALVDLFVYNLPDFKSSLIQNSQNFIGGLDYQEFSPNQSILKISQAALGIFLISLFVADFSSKRKY